jgi:hypothetical protein
MTILTVYFCGTGSNKFDESHANYWNGELISSLAANNKGKEFAEWVILDGPGSGNLQRKIMSSLKKQGYRFRTLRLPDHFGGENMTMETAKLHSRHFSSKS